MKLGAIATAPMEPDKQRGRPPTGPAPVDRVPAPKHEKTTRRLGSWLLAYQQYTARSESPDIFHMWAGLSAIAAVTTRRVYLRYTYGTIYSNIYVGLVGRPATKKTTAIKMAYKIVKKVVPQHMLPSAGSAAAIIASLAEMSDMPVQAGNLISEELGSLIRQGDTDVVNTLTDLFDCNEDIYKRTIGRGKELIAKPWLNFAFGTTPQWMGAHMDSSMAEGGFFSRVIFINCDEIKFTEPRPMVTDEFNQLEADLTNDLIYIHSLQGEVKWSEEAGKVFDAWYMDEQRVTSGDPRIEGYLVRKAVHVQKVAMLLMLSERDDMILIKRDIEVALMLLASIEKGVSTAVGSVGRNDLLPHAQSILRQIQSSGGRGTPLRDVIRKHSHNLKMQEIQEVINTFASTGEVKRGTGSDAGLLFYVKQRGS